MKRDKAEYVEANDPSFVRQTPNGYLKGFHINTTRVVRTTEHYPFADHGSSIGQMVDDTIMTALGNKEEIQTLTIEFSAEDWTALVMHDY